MMNWPNYEEDQQPQRKTILPYLMIAAIVVGLITAATLYSGKVYPAPLFSATAEGATITLTDEPCAVKEIGNLPFRATWVDKDKRYEGCWGAHREIGMVLAYFDDRTIAVIPISAFARVTGA